MLYRFRVQGLSRVHGVRLHGAHGHGMVQG